MTVRCMESGNVNLSRLTLVSPMEVHNRKHLSHVKNLAMQCFRQLLLASQAALASKW